MHVRGQRSNILEDVLDAYIIEEIKRQEDRRRRDEEEGRPRLRIEIPSKRADIEAPDEDVDEDDPDSGQEREDDGVVHISF